VLDGAAVRDVRAPLIRDGRADLLRRLVRGVGTAHALDAHDGEDAEDQQHGGDPPRANQLHALSPLLLFGTDARLLAGVGALPRRLALRCH